MKTYPRLVLECLVLALMLVPSASAVESEVNITIDGVDLDDEDAMEQLYESEMGGDLVFSDVPSDHWAFPYLGSNAPLITSGAIDDDAGLYSCAEPASRAEAVKIISVLFRIPEQEQSGDLGFDDVEADAWYETYLNNLVSLGVINGYSDGTFRPDGNVTRAETVKILASLMYESTGFMGENNFGSENYSEMVQVGSEPESFTDVDSEDWFYPYVDFFSRGSLVEGYEDGTFQPNANVTRCELASIVGKSYFTFATTIRLIEGLAEAMTGEDLEGFWENL